MKDFQNVPQLKKKLLLHKKNISKFVKKRLVLISFLAVLGVFLMVLTGLIVFDTSIRQATQQSVVRLVPPIAIPAQAEYPYISEQAIKSQDISISALSAVVIDSDSQVILYEKNSDQKYSMASTTKIMTALTALEYFNTDDVLEVYTERVEGATVGLKKGEIFFFEDLLYAMLLPSGNDAALTIAQNFPGGEAAFVKKMNENASLYHLPNTFYQDPAGLDEKNFSTVKDLARLASIAIKNEYVAKIVSTKQKVISTADKSRVINISNLNRLLGKDGVNGVKTGFTEEAGEVLVTSRKHNNHTIIIVVMRSKDRFSDTQALLSGVGKNVSYKKLTP